MWLAWSPKASESKASITRENKMCVTHPPKESGTEAVGRSWKQWRGSARPKAPPPPACPPLRPAPVPRVTVSPSNTQGREEGVLEMAKEQKLDSLTLSPHLKNKNKNRTPQSSRQTPAYGTSPQKYLRICCTHTSQPPKHAMKRQGNHYCWKWRQSNFLWSKFKLLTLSKFEGGQGDFTNP